MYNINPVLDFQLLKNSFESVIQDEFFQQYLMVSFHQNFDMFSQDQKTDIIKYLCIINYLNQDIVLKYFDFYKQNDIESITEYIKNMPSEQLSYQLNVLVFVSKYIEDQKFEELLPKHIIDLYFKYIYQNLEENFKIQTSIENYIEIEKLVPSEVPYFFSFQQKQELKSLIADILEKRFNVQETKGRYLHHKKDKSASRLIRYIFERTDRHILNNVIILQGNYLLTRDKQDFKFDFTLFTYLKRYQYAYRLYLDEALWPIKNLTKAFSNSLKKQSQIDHALGFIVFHKIKVYLDLNYDTIQKKDNIEYRKNIWSKIIKESIYNLEEYLQQLTEQDNLLERILNFNELQTLKSKQLNNNNQEISSNEDSKLKKQDPDTYTLQKLNIQDDVDVESEIDYNTVGSSNNNKNKSSQQLDEDQIKSIQQREQFLKLKKQKQEQLQEKIKELGYIEINIFQQKISQESIIPLKYYVNMIEAIVNMVYNFNKSFTPTLNKTLTNFLAQEQNQKIFQTFPMLPSILESYSCLQTHSLIFSKSIKKSWVLPEIQEKFDQTLEIINNLFNKNEGNYVKIMEEIENMTKELDPRDWEKDRAYDIDLFQKEIQNRSYFQNPEYLQNAQNHLDEIQKDEKILKLNYKRDYLNERFAINNANIVQKILNSEALRTVLNQTHYSKMVGQNLEQIYGKENVQNHFVQYPFICDYLIKNKKVVVQVLDSRKLLGGVDNVITGYCQKSERFFQLKGYQVVYIAYKDYQLDPQEFQQKIQEIINNKINSNNNSTQQ